MNSTANLAAAEGTAIRMSDRLPDRPFRAALIEICRSRWELQKRVSALEAELSEQTAVARELRERIATSDCQQRELLKGIAMIVDDCDDILQIETVRFREADAEDPAARQSRKWHRRLDRIRARLVNRLEAYGVTVRNPVGTPQPDLDRIHSSIKSDAVSPGGIIKVLRKGLLWNGSVLRSSLVVVAAPGHAVGEALQPTATLRDDSDAPTSDTQDPTPSFQGSHEGFPSK